MNRIDMFSAGKKLTMITNKRMGLNYTDDVKYENVILVTGNSRMQWSIFDWTMMTGKADSSMQ